MPYAYRGLYDGEDYPFGFDSESYYYSSTHTELKYRKSKFGMDYVLQSFPKLGNVCLVEWRD